MVAIIKHTALLLILSWLDVPAGTLTSNAIENLPPPVKLSADCAQNLRAPASVASYDVPKDCRGRLCQIGENIIVCVAPDNRDVIVTAKFMATSHSGICSCGRPASLGVPIKNGILWERVMCRTCGKAERGKAGLKIYSLARRCRVCARHALYAFPAEGEKVLLVGKKRPHNRYNIIYFIVSTEKRGSFRGNKRPCWHLCNIRVAWFFPSARTARVHAVARTSWVWAVGML
jgi:hypothetical protein